jgi:KDO2-lipid IV(A) lauroyltransferase
LLYCLFSKKDKNAVKENLTVLFPDYQDKQVNIMAREVFKNFAKYLIDFFRFSLIDKEYIEKYVKIEGFQNLKGALKEGKGVIAVLAHLGNWELGGIVLSLLDIPFAAVTLQHKDKNIDRFFTRQRQVTGAEVISTGSTLRRCFSALKENYALALVGDRDYFDNGIKVNFFGRPTFLPRGPAVLSRRCGSPIVPVFMIRNGNDTFTFKFYEPIGQQSTKEEHRDLVATTEGIARVLENIIKEYPTQWYVFRRFWERIGWERRQL